MQSNLKRRKFMAQIGKGLLATALLPTMYRCAHRQSPNVIFILADQWRAQDMGYMGNSIVKTPNLDQLAQESVRFTTAISGCPVCSPYRASLMTGQYWLTHGIFYNDKPLNPDYTTLGKVFQQTGYQTGYIGKWHLNGHFKGETVRDGRNRPIPRERRHGFDFWKVRECTHNYNHSRYYDEDNHEHIWDGYDAIAQTETAQQFIREQADSDQPFFLFLSWGPPHAPYGTAPEKYRNMFNPENIPLRENVPPEFTDKAREAIAGYYAHIAALDDCMGQVLQTINEPGIHDNTIIVFTSDHGDMLYSHGFQKKQQPWDESIRVPLLIRYPIVHGEDGREVDMPINTPDLMPTLLGLAEIPIPDSVEGTDFSGIIRNHQVADNPAALLACPVPFHQWNYHHGGREYRGIRTRRYTYIRDLNGPWLLFDNQQDPYQLNNLCNQPECATLQNRLEEMLQAKLKQTNDEFHPGPVYMQQWDYEWDGNDRPEIDA